jgi:hypothetical protein
VTREHSAVGSNGQVRAALCGATWTGETKAQRRIRDASRRRERHPSPAAGGTIVALSKNDRLFSKGRDT